MNEKQLLELKEKITTAKSEVNKLQGQQDYMLKEFKTNFGCSSIEEAKEKSSEFTTEINKLTKQINTGLQKLEEQINGNAEIHN
jgi:hypothetical protein